LSTIYFLFDLYFDQTFCWSDEATLLQALLQPKRFQMSQSSPLRRTRSTHIKVLTWTPPRSAAYRQIDALVAAGENGDKHVRRLEILRHRLTLQWHEKRTKTPTTFLSR
jgi:hypothetical protein